jgi:DNA polymerase-1
VCIYSIRKQQDFGRAELLADWGIAPEQVIDLQTLVGDSVDNVPGVPGIGIKTAAKLLQDFGSLEGILAHLDKVPGAKKQQSLREAAETLKLSRSLVTLAVDVPMTIDWDAWSLKPIDVPRLLKLCQEWGFHRLANQLREGSLGLDNGRAGATAAAPLSQKELFEQGEEMFPFGANAPEGETAGIGQEEEKPAAPGLTHVGSPGWPATYHLVDTEAKFQAFLAQLQEQKRFAFDLETTSLQPLEAEIVGLAFSWKQGEAWYLAVRGPAGSTLLDPKSTLIRLRPILENPRKAKVNQNIKYDLLVLRANGVAVQGVAGDSMVADYLLHAGERSHNLEELARRYLHHQVIPITDLIGKKSRKQAQLRMDQVAPERIAVYSGEDADVAWRLCDILEGQLGSEQNHVPGTSLRKLYDEVEIPLIDVLVEIESNGIRLDLPRLAQLSGEMQNQLDQIEKEIYALVGHPFNIGSLVQLRKVLFEELKLPPQRKTGVTGAASTDQETLERLAALNLPGSALPRKILEHRQIAKLKSTYVDALPALVSPSTGRLHTSFNQTVASTGRLSSSEPNLQNIPVRREQGQQIRQAFLPAESWVLLTADYSQIELRLLAHFAHDDELARAFAEDRDIHSAVAAMIFHVDEEAVTSAQRRVAKTVNFGVIYGMSAHGLAQRLSIPREEAERFISEYFARYQRVLDYQTQLLRTARQTGYVSTILGRRRQFDPAGIRPTSTYQQRSQAEREAINMEVQGSAADLIKLAMLRLHGRLRREGWRSRMLLTVHDELVFEAPPEEVSALASAVREEMTTPLEKTLGLRVPLKVDVATGPNWLDITDLPEAPKVPAGLVAPARRASAVAKQSVAP